MFNRKFTLIFIFLFFLSISFAHNSSYDDIYLDKNGWCVGVEVDYRILNQTEYNIYSGNYNDEEFQNLSEFTYRIYNGPFASMSVLFDDKKTTKEGYFSYTFNKSGTFLIEIDSKHSFNEYDEILDIIECVGVSTERYNLEFFDDIYMIQLYDSTFEFTTSPIIIEKIPNYDSSIYKRFKIIEEQSFKSDNGVKVGFEKKAAYTNYKLFINNSGWKKVTIKDLNTTEGKTYNSFDYKKGEYKITAERVADPEPVVLEDDTSEDNEAEDPSNEENNEDTSSDAKSNQNNNLVDDSNSVNSDSDITSNNVDEIATDTTLNTTNNGSSNSTNIILAFVFFVVVVGAVVLFILKDKKKTVPIKSESSEEILYKQVKEYVKKYRDSYSKDQIFRALKKGKIPYNIIEKVFREEF